VVGYDHFAFFETLLRAAQAVRFDFAQRVLTIGVSTSDTAIETASEKAGICEPLDVALGFAIDRSSVGTHFDLLGVTNEEEFLLNYPAAVRYEAVWSKEGLTFPLSIPVSGHDAMGATGAVLILSAAMHHERLASSARGGPEFAVSLRDDNRFMAAVFRLGNGSLFAHWITGLAIPQRERRSLR